MNQKKIKSIIFLSFLVIVLLLFFSVFLTIKISKAKDEIENQKTQISQLEETIKNYENLPNGNYEEIIQK